MGTAKAGARGYTGKTIGGVKVLVRYEYGVVQQSMLASTERDEILDFDALMDTFIFDATSYAALTGGELLPGPPERVEQDFEGVSVVCYLYPMVREQRVVVQ